MTPRAARDLATDLARMQQAAADPQCAAWLGLAVPGASLPGGARLPGLCHELDPLQAAFNLGVMLAWHAESREPAAAMHAVCAAALLAAGDWHARRQRRLAARLPTLGELLSLLAAHDAAPSAASAVRAVLRLVQTDVADAAPIDAWVRAAVIEPSPRESGTQLSHALDIGQRAAQAVRIALLCERRLASVLQLVAQPSPRSVPDDASTSDLPIDAYVARWCGT